MKTKPLDEQLVLDVVLHAVRACEHCDATTQAECQHEREQRDYGRLTKRPRACLFAYDPSTSDWPAGF